MQIEDEIIRTRLFSIKYNQKNVLDGPKFNKQQVIQILLQQIENQYEIEGWMISTMNNNANEINFEILIEFKNLNTLKFPRDSKMFSIDGFQSKFFGIHPLQNRGRIYQEFKLVDESVLVSLNWVEQLSNIEKQQVEKIWEIQQESQLILQNGLQDSVTMGLMSISQQGLIIQFINHWEKQVKDQLLYSKVETPEWIGLQDPTNFLNPQEYLRIPFMWNPNYKKIHYYIYGCENNIGKSKFIDLMNKYFRCFVYNFKEKYQNINGDENFILMDDFRGMMIWDLKDLCSQNVQIMNKNSEQITMEQHIVIIVSSFPPRKYFQDIEEDGFNSFQLFKCLFNSIQLTKKDKWLIQDSDLSMHLLDHQIKEEYLDEMNQKRQQAKIAMKQVRAFQNGNYDITKSNVLEPLQFNLSDDSSDSEEIKDSRRQLSTGQKFEDMYNQEKKKSYQQQQKIQQNTQNTSLKLTQMIQNQKKEKDRTSCVNKKRNQQLQEKRIRKQDQD